MVITLWCLISFDKCRVCENDPCGWINSSLFTYYLAVQHFSSEYTTIDFIEEKFWIVPSLYTSVNRDDDLNKAEAFAVIPFHCPPVSPSAQSCSPPSPTVINLEELANNLLSR